jgi:hypothetical protein
VSITFDIFRTADDVPRLLSPDPNDEDCMWMSRVVMAATLEIRVTGRLGFILEHKYSKDQTPCGKDALLLDALSKLPRVRIELCPVVIKYRQEGNGCGDVESESAEVKVANLPWARVPEPEEYVTFYPLSCGYLMLEQSHEAGAAYTGNESRASSDEMIYFAHAAVLTLEK